MNEPPHPEEGAGCPEPLQRRRREAGKADSTNFAMTLQHHGMSTMNVSLPQALRSFVDEQVASRGYGAASEYVRELLRQDRDRQLLLGLLLDGAASASTAPADEAYFGELRERVRTSGPA